MNTQIRIDLLDDCFLVAHPTLVKDQRDLLDSETLDLGECKVDDNKPDGSCADVNEIVFPGDGLQGNSVGPTSVSSQQSQEAPLNT